MTSQVCAPATAPRARVPLSGRRPFFLFPLLADQGILRPPVELLGQKLSSKLLTRPSPSEVKELGVRKSPIEAAKERLVRRSLSGSLASAIEKRPSLETLKAMGIAQEAQ